MTGWRRRTLDRKELKSVLQAGQGQNWAVDPLAATIAVVAVVSAAAKQRTIPTEPLPLVVKVSANVCV
jgi:hypothetical protein